MTETEIAETLAALKAEREKFTRSDTSLMQRLVDRLVAGGVYPPPTPAMLKHNYSHLSMVQSWGEDWYLWRGTLNCPKCKSDWRALDLGPPFKREIGRSQGDMTVSLSCPDCNHVIPRNFG